MLDNILTPEDQNFEFPSSSSTKTSSGKAFTSFYLLTKGLRVLALFFTFDLFKGLHLIPGLFLVYVGSSIFFLIRQKPFGHGPSLSIGDFLSVARYSFVYLCLQLTWFYGLTLCGPLRTILVTEQTGATLLTGLLALFCRHSDASHGKIRGAVLYILGILFLLFIDHDDNSPHHKAYHAGHASQHQEIYTIFTHMFSWTDISDHKGGVLLLSALTLISSFVRWYGRRVAVVVGGAKKLHALTTLFIACFLFPWAVYHHEAFSILNLNSVVTLIFIIVFVKLADFYAEMGVSKPRDNEKLRRFGTFVSYGMAFLIGTVWTHSVTFGWKTEDEVQVEDHQLSPGVMFASLIFALVTLNLTSSAKSGTRGYFVGYSEDGLPLFNLASGSFGESSFSILEIVRQELKKILESRNSRRIFYFLLLNLGFALVEFTYGIWSNSLGLISDAFHMLFDCSALVIGLYADVLSKWKPSQTFSYGYDRFEILSGFVNGLFLAIIAINVFCEALRRLFDPPIVGTEKLLAVSIAGLIVNLFGIFLCRQSNGGSSHGHSHNVNMEGVFLHIMADTLGSVGVIISSFLIDRYQLQIADPICSLFLAVTIFTSVLPLLRQSTSILLLTTPYEVEENVIEGLNTLKGSVADIKEVSRVYVWCHLNDKIHANVSVLVENSADVQVISDQICGLLKNSGVKFPVIQVEKEKFSQYLQGMETNVYYG